VKCRTIDGVRIPGCWPAVIYGDDHCTCGEAKERRSRAARDCDDVEELLVKWNCGQHVTRERLIWAIEAVRRVRAELSAIDRD
jgi:hypothetical protein